MGIRSQTRTSRVDLLVVLVGSLYGYLVGLIAGAVGWVVVGGIEGAAGMVVDACFVCFAVDFEGGVDGVWTL